MKGYIDTVDSFLNRTKEQIVSELCIAYPMAEKSQIESWETLIDDIKSSSSFNKLPKDCTIAIEYELPTDGMAIDMVVTGLNSSGEKEALIVESKRWNDSMIRACSFSAYREDGKELHPQVQVAKHKLSFSQYLDMGHNYSVMPFVFLRNCTQEGADNLVAECPRNNCKSIQMSNKMNYIINAFANRITTGDPSSVQDLRDAVYCPSIEIINAMKNIISKEEPFILTEEQTEAVKTIKQSIAEGKKIIRIMGAAGTGKTAILLNLYVEYLDNKENSDIRPIFISGAQNTALYRSLYPDVENSFSYSFSLDRMVAKTKGNLYVLLMDEAQHNAPGIITKMVERGCTLILCYDEGQTINAENAIEELNELETREDFTAIELNERIRFNGSQYAENNIKSVLEGNTNLIEDPDYDLRVLDTFSEFQETILQTINNHPESTVAVAGLLSNDSAQFTKDTNPDSIFFTNWKNKSECEWIPYVYRKNYLAENDGKIWVGTWWMPGLDVDYIAVIVGGDARMTANGLVAVPEQAKHYRMMVSVATTMGLPDNLIKEKKVFGKMSVDYRNTSRAILEYLNQHGNERLKEEFLRVLTGLLKNNYYITMSRGRKGCFVYFTDK